MPAGTSLGHGIGLQTPRGLDDKWIQRLAGENRQDELAARKREDDLVKETEFDIDFGKYLPPYGKKIADIQRQMYNDIARYKQGNNGKLSTGYVKDRVMRAKQEIGALEISNANWLDHMKRTGIMKKPEALKAVSSMDTTFEDLKKFNDGRFYQIGDNGEFSYTAVPDTNIPVKFDVNTDYEESYLPETRPFAGRTEVTKVRKISDNATQREVGALVHNRTWIDQQMFNNPQLLGLPPEVIKGELEKIALSVVEPQKPRGYEQKELLPPTGRSGSGADKEKIKPVIEYDVKAQVVKTSEDRLAAVETKDAEGNVVKTETFPEDEITTTRPLFVATPKASAVTIPINKEMLDADTNRPLTGTKNINFKPDGVTVLWIKKSDGTAGWRKYATGVVQEQPDATDEETSYKKGTTSTTPKKTFRVLVPYDGTGAASAIESSYDMGEFDKKFSELPNRGGKKAAANTAQDEWKKKWSALKSGETLVGLDGKTYKKK